jgi:hypothetical protein
LQGKRSPISSRRSVVEMCSDPSRATLTTVTPRRPTTSSRWTFALQLCGSSCLTPTSAAQTTRRRSSCKSESFTSTPCHSPRVRRDQHYGEHITEETVHLLLRRWTEHGHVQLIFGLCIDRLEFLGHSSSIADDERIVWTDQFTGCVLPY